MSHANISGFFHPFINGSDMTIAEKKIGRLRLRKGEFLMTKINDL